MSTPEGSDDSSTNSGADSETPSEEVVIDELDDEDARPHQFKPIHRVNDDAFGVAEKRICDLHEPEYDPRESLDPNEVAARADAIAKPHGHADLIVREIEGAPEQCEVLKERLDLAALRHLHGEDSTHQVPCIVREVDDRTAMLVMLSAYDWQVGLTAAEKARMYAKLISVTYGDDEQSLEAYLNSQREADDPIELPSNNHSQVEALADDLRPHASVIARRLRLLIVPEPVKTLVRDEELSVRNTAIIADGLRKIPDAAVRRKKMSALASECALDAESITRSELRDRVQSMWEAYDAQQDDGEQWSKEQIEDLEAQLSTQQRDLRELVASAINYYNGHELTIEEVATDNRHEVSERALMVAERCEEFYEHLYEARVEPLTEQKGACKRDRTRTEENKSIHSDEERDDCSYCGRPDLTERDLDNRIDRLDAEIDDLTDRIETARSERDTFRNKGRQLEEFVDDLEATKSQLDRAREQYTDGSDGGDS